MCRDAAARLIAGAAVPASPPSAGSSRPVTGNSEQRYPPSPDAPAELVTAGATTVREESYGEHLGHVVMLDPEGNEFCVA